jgi:hypothetical protein
MAGTSTKPASNEPSSPPSVLNASTRPAWPAACAESSRTICHASGMLVPSTSARGSSSSDDTIISTLTSCGMVTGAPCSITIRRGSCGTAAMAKPVSSASAS